MDIFFDLDGTLLDVWPRHYAVYCDLLAEWGKTPLAFARYQALKRADTPLGDILAESTARELTPQFREGWLARIERLDYLDKDSVIVSARAMLHRLGVDHHLVLVTLRQLPQALTDQLARLSLADMFARVLVAGTCAADWSFKVRLIQGCCEHPAGWLVGDTEADIRAAAALGLHSCAVSWGLRSPEFLAALDPDVLVHTVDALALTLQNERQPRRDARA